MNRLPAECLRLILGHLGLKMLFSTKSVCKSFLNIIKSQDLCEEYLLHNFCPIYPGLSVLNAHEALLSFGRQLLMFKSSRLLHDVVSVSSVDRAAEGPRNVLAISGCYALVNARPTLNPVHCQIRCGCAGPNPCYWSSSPSESEEKTEFITFTLKAPVSVLIGFYVAPYQAYFHPGAPIYGPKEIAIQILKPRNDPVSVLSDENLFDHYQHPSLDLEADVYYQSPFYPVENTRKDHFIYLPKMVLCIGQVRVLFRGMHTRQPGQQFMLASDDFYLCISRLEVVGIDLQNYNMSFANSSSNVTSSINNAVQEKELVVLPAQGPSMALEKVFLPLPLPHHYNVHSTL